MSKYHSPADYIANGSLASSKPFIYRLIFKIVGLVTFSSFADPTSGYNSYGKSPF
jgi:hypothetical protein